MNPDSFGGAEGGGMLEPKGAAEMIFHGLAREESLILTHSVVRTYVQRKASDYDRWLKRMRRVRDRVAASRLPAGKT
jgi:hypothetical protein